MYRYLVIAVFVVFPFVAFAATNNNNSNSDQRMTGKTLMSYCADFSKKLQKSSPVEDRIHAHYCLGFIGGAVESQHFISFFEAVKDKDYRKDMSSDDFHRLMQKYRLFCLPGDIYFKDLVPVVVNFGKKHPEVLNYPAGVLVYSALRNKYPCK